MLPMNLANNPLWGGLELHVRPEDLEVAQAVTTMISNPEAHRPSLGAGLTDAQRQLSVTIRRVDALFIEQAEKQRTKLINAAAADLATSQGVRDGSKDFLHAIAKGGMKGFNLTYNTPVAKDVPVIREALGIILGFLGTVTYTADHILSLSERAITGQNRLFGQTTYDLIGEENSVERNKWIAKVKTLDDERKDAAKDLVGTRAIVIRDEINGNPDLYDRDIVDELEALILLYHSFDGQTLMVEEQTARAFIDSINNENN